MVFRKLLSRSKTLSESIGATRVLDKLRSRKATDSDVTNSVTLTLHPMLSSLRYLSNPSIPSEGYTDLISVVYRFSRSTYDLIQESVKNNIQLLLRSFVLEYNPAEPAFNSTVGTEPATNPAVFKLGFGIGGIDPDVHKSVPDISSWGRTTTRLDMVVEFDEDIVDAGSFIRILAGAIAGDAVKRHKGRCENSKDILEAVRYTYRWSGFRMVEGEGGPMVVTDIGFVGWQSIVEW